jgi:hypothetical protein
MAIIKLTLGIKQYHAEGQGSQKSVSISHHQRSYLTGWIYYPQILFQMIPVRSQN